MFKTKHAVIGVVIALAILIGLLIAVRVSAPTDMEAAVLQASVIFASGAETSYPVSVVVPDKADKARTALIDKMFAGAGNAMDVREEYLYPAPQPTQSHPAPSSVFLPQTPLDVSSSTSETLTETDSTTEVEVSPDATTTPFVTE